MENISEILQKQKKEYPKSVLDKHNNYVIAIPSYKRAETLRDRTLAILQKYKINPNKIHIFVADKSEEKSYKEILPNYYKKIVIGKKGIKNIRNFMPKYFLEGQKIFYMDDDCYALFECVRKSSKLKPSKSYRSNKSNKSKSKKQTRDKSNQKLIPLKNLDKFIKSGFQDLHITKLGLFGIYPVDDPPNAFFMRATDNKQRKHISTRLCYIIGYCAGTINKRVCEVRTIDDKEDFERSIKYYLHDGGVLRYNNITAKSKCYKEPGGMQVERTKERVKRSALYLNRKYPDLTRYKVKESTGFSEVVLKDKREKQEFGLKVMKSYDKKNIKY